jgi:hypothetical protein
VSGPVAGLVGQRAANSGDALLVRLGGRPFIALELHATLGQRIDASVDIDDWKS